MLMLLATPSQNDAILALNQGIYQVMPRLVAAGLYAGWYAVDATVKNDARYVRYQATLATLMVAEVNAATAWPPVSE